MTPRPRPHALRRAFTLLELVIVIGIILVLMGLVLGVGSVVIAQSEERQVRSSMQIIDSALLEFEQQAGRPMIFEGWHRSNDSSPFHTGFRRGSSNADIHVDVPLRPMLGNLSSNGSAVNALMVAANDGGYGWASDGNCFPWSDNFSARHHDLQWMSAALSVMGRNPACAAIMAKADPQLLRAVTCITGASGGSPVERSFNMPEFIDPWGRQVVIVFPGRRFWDDDFDYDNNPSPYSTSVPGDPLGLQYPLVKDPDGSIRTPHEHQYGICRNQRPLLVSSGPDGKLGNRFADPSGSAGEVKAFEESQDNIYSYEPLSVRSDS